MNPPNDKSEADNGSRPRQSGRHLRLQTDWFLLNSTHPDARRAIRPTIAYRIRIPNIARLCSGGFLDQTDIDGSAQACQRQKLFTLLLSRQPLFGRRGFLLATPTTRFHSMDIFLPSTDRATPS